MELHIHSNLVAAEGHRSVQHDLVRCCEKVVALRLKAYGATLQCRQAIGDPNICNCERFQVLTVVGAGVSIAGVAHEPSNGKILVGNAEYPGQCSATWCWILVKFSRTGRENILGGVAVGAPYSGRAADHQCCTRRINSSSPPTEYIRVRFPFNANRWIFWACSQPELSCDTATEYF